MRGKENLKKEIWYVLILLLATYAVASGKVIYVDDDAAGANDGSSWSDAYNYLQDALAVASAGDEIRVAQGIYRPDLGGGNTVGDRRATFQLKSGVTIKGGYAGAGEADANAVNVNLYKSILSGDLNGDDVEVEGYEPYELLKIFDIPTRKDNSCYVVIGNHVDETAVLNGFTITSGVCSLIECSDSNLYAQGGAAIRIESGRPQILNCRITDNFARFGAVLNNDSNSTFVGCILSKNYVSNIVNISGNPVFTNCIFEQSEFGMENHDGSNPMLTNCIFEQSLAGMENRDGSSPMLTNCVFRENEYGMENRSSGSKAVLNNCRFINDGGISNSGDNSLILVDCIFSNSGGIDCSFDGNLILNNCLFENGGVGISARRCSLTLSNCIFSSNSGFFGAGIYSHYSDLVLYNCKFVGNVASAIGGGISCSGGNVTLYNCIFSGNSASDGGAIDSRNCSLVLQNCLLSDNSAERGGAGIDAGGGTVVLYNCTLSGNGNTTDWWAGGGIHYLGIRNTLTNCILWGNTPNQISGMASVSYSNIQGGFQGDGNIDVDPLFADPNNGDYHLKSQAGRWDPNDGRWTIDDVTSPCIDTGDPRSDCSAEPEPNGGRINMGAYGGTPEASFSYITN
jgi:predicted outer membrane repeat protein